MKILTQDQASTIVTLAVERLANYVKEYGLQALINGISGGIDSAVVAGISRLTALRLRTEGYTITERYLYIGIESDSSDLVKARLLAQAFGLELEEIDLTTWYRQSPIKARVSSADSRKKVHFGNQKCRLRMVTLSQEANIYCGIYLDTDDLSEEGVGFWTVRGDTGDVKLIQHLTKIEVYDLGEYLGVPDEILQSAPGDGLGVTASNTATSQLGLDYIFVDYIISRFQECGFDINGGWEQFDQPLFQQLVYTVATEINVIPDQVQAILNQAVKTRAKRKYGDNVAHLLPSRTELGLPELGTPEFASLYLAAIRQLN